MSMPLRFVRSQQESQGTHSFLFETSEALNFQAGQYLQLTLPHGDVDDRGDTRWFTISSAPHERLLRITTRIARPSSSFKHALTGLAPGALAQAEGPAGDFTYRDEARPAVFIAGGIGITPFRSILADQAARQQNKEITLLYSNATTDLPFKGFLDGLRREWPRLTLVYTVTRPSPGWAGPTGRVDISFIARHVPHAADATFYICGPSAMVSDMRTLLRDGGLDDSRVHHEGFPGYEPAVSRPIQVAA